MKFIIQLHDGYLAGLNIGKTKVTVEYSHLKSHATRFKTWKEATRLAQWILEFHEEEGFTVSEVKE